jgi:glycosyltransferase involved in cell wall biosynthesis
MAGSVFALSTAVGIAESGPETVLVMPRAGESVSRALAYYGKAAPANLRIVLPASQEVRVGPLAFTSTARYYRAVRDVLAVEAQGAGAVIVRTLKLAHFLSRSPLPAPLLYEMHDWYTDVERKWAGAGAMVGARKLARERRLESVEHATIGRVDGVIALRQATGELMRACYPEARVAVIPTGLTLPETMGAVSDEPVVVYAGQLHRHKGIEILLEALRRAPDLRGLILGGGDLLADLRRNVRRLGLAERVELTGHVPAAEVPARLRRGRVGVLPLLDCFFNRYLTSPVKIMEYYAAGLPVVTADAPVTREVVEPEITGLLTPFGDADALAAALRRLCMDGELHARCRANIAARLPGYSWENRGRKIAEFVGSLGRA